MAGRDFKVRPSVNGSQILSGDYVVATSAIQFTGKITPASFNGSQIDDYAPTGLSTAAVIRQDASSNTDITGLTGGMDGRVIVFANISSTAAIVLKHDVT